MSSHLRCQPHISQHRKKVQRGCIKLYRGFPPTHSTMHLTLSQPPFPLQYGQFKQNRCPAPHFRSGGSGVNVRQEPSISIPSGRLSSSPWSSPSLGAASYCSKTHIFHSTRPLKANQLLWQVLIRRKNMCSQPGGGTAVGGTV